MIEKQTENELYLFMNNIVCRYFNKKFTSLLLLSFLLFCLIPCLRLLPFNLDKQPNALILSFFIIGFLGNNKIIKDIAWLLFVTAAAAICMLFSWEDWLALEIFTNYLSLFFIAYASYLTLNRLGGMPYALFKWVVYIWFTVGGVQYFFYPSFMEFLLFRSNNDLMLESGRGVTALSTEPTGYGMTCLLFLIINYLNFRNQSTYKLLTLLLMVQTILFSLSSTCFFCIAISISLYIISKILTSNYRFYWLFLLTVSCYIGYHVILYLLENVDIRFTRLLQYLLDDPAVFFINNGNHRFGGAFFSIKGFFDDWGMPHGFGYFDKYIERVIENPIYAPLISIYVLEQRKTITAIGGPLFELGIFALPIYYIIVNAFKKISLWIPKADLYLFLLITLMLNSINFNNTILSLIIGNLIYLKRSGNTTIANENINTRPVGKIII